MEDNYLQNIKTIIMECVQDSSEYLNKKNKKFKIEYKKKNLNILKSKQFAGMIEFEKIKYVKNIKQSCTLQINLFTGIWNITYITMNLNTHL